MDPFNSALVTELWAGPSAFEFMFSRLMAFASTCLSRFGDHFQFRGLELQFDIPRWLARQPNANCVAVFLVENAGPRRRLCSSSVRVLYGPPVWSSLCSFVLWIRIYLRASRGVLLLPAGSRRQILHKNAALLLRLSWSPGRTWFINKWGRGLAWGGGRACLPAR